MLTILALLAGFIASTVVAVGVATIHGWMLDRQQRRAGAELREYLRR